MRIPGRSGLFAATAIGTVLSAPALAQLPAATPAGEPAANRAPARVTEPDTGDIIVTARRVEERLQDVPISITVFNQKQLDDRNIANGTDLATYTPSLTATTRFGSANTTFALRGFTQETRTSPSVAVYFADVVAPRAGNGGTPSGNGAGPGSFFDLQNVQVLKGPQGTLFGRNTTGGAILLVPRKPTDRLEGYIEGTYGNYDTRRVQAVLNAPLGEQARLRIGIDRYKRDGYIRNISGIGPSDFADIDYIAARASLVVDLTPNLENYTIASYTRSDTNGPLTKLTKCFPGFPFGTLACNQIARLSGRPFLTSENILPNPRSLLDQWQIVNTTTWRASDALTIKNITSYAQFKGILRSNIFGARYVIPASFGPIANTGSLAGLNVTFADSYNPTNRLSADQSSFTEELQFQGQFGDRLTYQAGGYFETSDPLSLAGAQSPLFLACSDPSRFRCIDPIGTLIGRPGLGSINYAAGETAFRNIGLYAQATYDLADQLKLTGGLRYTFDRTRTYAQQVTYRFFQPNVPTGFCTYPAPGTPANVPGKSPGDCIVQASQKSDAPTWLVGLDYNPIDDVLLYGKYSRGYRQGSANYSAPVGFQTFGPEKVDTYEIGTKTSFRGAIRGTLNVAAFYNDFTNQQLALGLQSSTNAATPNQAIVNGGKSRIYGVEVDGSLSPFQGLTLDGSYAYLNTRLKSLTVPPLPANNPYDTFQFAAVAGSRLAFTPSHKATVTLTYVLPLPESVGEISIGGTYSYTSNQLIVSSVNGTLPAINLFNANLTWSRVAGMPIDATFFATNVTNKKYYSFINDQTRSGFISQTLGEPRIYGLRARYRFGS